MEIPSDLLYTEDHEWVRVEGTSATVGITDFAQSELGDIVYVEIEAEGEALKKGDTFGSVEAVKTVSDLFMPIDGTVGGINEGLEDEPEQVNSDPYGSGWMVKLEDIGSTDHLLSAEQYKEQLGEKG